MNADQRRAPTPDGGSRSPGHGPKIRPVDDRTLGLQSDPLDFYKTSTVRQRSWKVTFVRVRVSQIAQLMNSLRQTHAGGRPARPTPCSRCGAPCPSARAARVHCRRKVVRDSPGQTRAAGSRDPIPPMTSAATPSSFQLNRVRVKVSTVARAMNSLRQAHAGGRPPKPTPCPRCGAALPSACAAREHCRRTVQVPDSSATNDLTLLQDQLPD